MCPRLAITMVEILRAPSLGQNMHGSGNGDVASRFSEMKMTPIYETKVLETSEVRRDAAQSNKSNTYKPPRRAFSSNDYHLPSAASSSMQRTGAPSTTFPAAPASSLPASSQIKHHLDTTPTPLSPGAPQDSDASPGTAQILLPTPSSSESVLTFPTKYAPPIGYYTRPTLPSPQRSYSVMDYEPIPARLLPGGKLQLPYLPPEIHYAIFDFLDPIDATCLGLTSKHFYTIHRTMHGSVPLNARRMGPNDMEWAWRLAGPLIAAGTPKDSAMAMLLPRGQVYCRKCGTSRCELHKHIQDFFGDNKEYCEVSGKFGRKAQEGARKSCFRSSPRHPHRCGRHTRQQRVVRLV